MALLLRFTGLVMVLAFPMALLPTEWMAASHRALGLGAFPSSPLVEYLTRSISLLYGFHGVLVLVVARDVHRFAPIVAYLGWMNICFGLGMTMIDLAAGLPWYWTMGEGPPVAVVGAMILFLRRAAIDELVNQNTRHAQQ